MILDYLANTEKISTVISDKVSRINNANQNFNIYTIASDYKKNNRMIFVVLPTLFEAQKYYDSLVNLFDLETVLFYPVDEMVASSLLIASSDFKFERINTIIHLLDKSPKIIVTNINGALRGNVPHNIWMDQIIKLKKGDLYDIKKLKTLLVEYGYKATELVTKPGEFSYRGSVIDFFPISTNTPVRLDFFDDELETIKLFDPASQLSISKINEIAIFPFVELFYSEGQKEEVINKLNSMKLQSSLEEADIIERDIAKIDLRSEVDTIFNYASLFYNIESILEFVELKKIYFINEEKIDNICFQIKREENQYYSDLNCKTLQSLHFFKEKDEVFNNQNITYIDTLVNLSDAYEINTSEIAPFNGSMESLIKTITSKLRKGYVVLSIRNPDRLRRIKDAFLEYSTPYKTVTSIKEMVMHNVNFINEEGTLSLFLPSDGIYILDESSIYTDNIEKRKIRYKSTFSEGVKISNYQDLAPGDYIVHMNYGIGYYEGIKTIELSGKKKDYISIKYAKDDHLYIPVDQLSMIKKYVGKTANPPQLTKLGSSSWAKTKEKVKEKVLELGKKLIDLYARREAAIGYSFAKDSADQAIFESEFPYEETVDQQAAIDAVKRDMESTRPMDRLVCGDVGYGKTEVALRAAFKAVMDGKQVCYLAPTTILTRQHYHTFKDRMEKYGIRVELLNRFVSTKDTKKILKDLAFGTVDVVIGTHRLLSDDVSFKDLGLLITDEEQRFGVMHKEKIKEMKVNVDSIMLTATPIPRTLQMSLVGIKELSLIETPPKNRYPVQTYVTPRHDSIIKEAIERELLRKGQIFYLYNYTEDIEDKCYELSKLVPEARVCYAHGKMDKNKLEEIVTDFIDHKYDMLVSTTIIETGIDIPEANTLIIHDSDKLGLSQLYQIRGRVGRSDRIAYAYLMYEPRKLLTSDAEKRLEAIKEFTELGSGFKIAMRDLTIRGAGDLLGQEQSGFIDSVGLDTYMETLDETLKEIKGEKQIKEQVRAPINKRVLADRYIPENYEISESLKIEIHKRISKVKTCKDARVLYGELTDRFGRVSKSLEVYIYERLFDNLVYKAGIENVDIKPKLATLTMKEEKSQESDGEFLYKTAYELSNNFTLMYKNRKIIITFKTSNYPNNTWLPLMCEYLEKIIIKTK